MARPLRLEYHGALWHVTARGNNREFIFHDDDDRNAFLSILANVVRMFNWRLHAWVIMGNHYHLMVSTPEPTLSKGMQRLNQLYAQRSNRKYQRSGHLFQGRFKAFLIDKHTWMLEVARYVVLNPVRAGMVRRPEEYRWSSYRSTAGLAPSPSWLTDEIPRGFHRDMNKGRKAYREFVLGKIDEIDSIWSNVKGQIYLGSEAFIDQVQALIDSNPRSEEHPMWQRYVARPTAIEAAETAASVLGTELDEVRATHGHPAKGVIAHVARVESLCTLREIARLLGLGSPGHVSDLSRRTGSSYRRVPAIRNRIDECVRALRSHAPPLPPEDVLIRAPF